MRKPSRPESAMRTPLRREGKDGDVTWRVQYRYRGQTTSDTFGGRDGKKRALRFCKLLDALGPQGALHQIYDGERKVVVPMLDEVVAERIAHLPAIVWPRGGCPVSAAGVSNDCSSPTNPVVHA